MSEAVNIEEQQREKIMGLENEVRSLESTCDNLNEEIRIIKQHNENLKMAAAEAQEMNHKLSARNDAMEELKRRSRR